MSQVANKNPTPQPKPVINLDVDISKIESSVLRRLIEEARNETPSTIRAFDRIHNRHNRSGW